MAHHVQDKATKHHRNSRPKKSRLSDINRRPPIYPAIPDGPWYEQTSGLTGPSKTVVSISVAPADTADTLREKLKAAGASAPEAIEFGGVAVTSTLGDAGLEAETTIEATVATAR